MHKLLFIPLFLALAAASFGVALPGAGFEPPAALTSLAADPFAGLPGIVLTASEAASIRGGDVVVKLNAQRTKLQVDVYINDSELRRLNPNPIKTLVLDAHNRVADTTKAPFMPANGDRDGMPLGAGLTTKPAPFPAGTWNITTVKPCAGSYGPNMIGTNAVGKVDVYANGVKVGSANDVGYAIHSNAKPFESSKSYGCIVVKKEDNIKLADILDADRRSAKAAGERCFQAIHADR